MQKWADVEAKKAQEAIDDCKQRVAAVLTYIESHMGT
jgi:hypothetical protein